MAAVSSTRKERNSIGDIDGSAIYTSKYDLEFIKVFGHNGFEIEFSGDQVRHFVYSAENNALDVTAYDGNLMMFRNVTVVIMYRDVANR